MTETITSRVLAELQQQIDSYSPTGQQQDVGIVLEAGDGIARVSGLSEARNAELVQFVNGSLGTVSILNKTMWASLSWATMRRLKKAP